MPVDNSGLGESVIPTEPFVRQVFVRRGDNCADQDAFERKLFVIRKQAEHRIDALGEAYDDFYASSFSSRTIVYKGMLLAGQVGDYYLDLKDETMVSALALVHQRFSTNTFPSWRLAHPYRMICHNGEINTLRGNINWLAARRHLMKSELLGDDLEKLWPLISEGQSDSATFDNALELLVQSGYSLAHAMMMLIPEAWTGNPLMDAKRRAFYEYHAALMEPWDGPAAVAFTDGRQIGATLDRNGLRPARYLITDDDFAVMGSEVGVLPIDEKRIVKKWRLQPGKMLLIDLEQGRIIDDDDIKAHLSSVQPYQEWLDRTRIVLEDLPGTDSPVADAQPANASRSPAGLRLHAGGSQVLDVSDGVYRTGSRRLDGQRHPDIGAVVASQAALFLFQTGLRPGHQPADRSDSRRVGDVAPVADRPAAQPPRHQQYDAAEASRGAPTRPHQPGPGKDPLDRRDRG